MKRNINRLASLLSVGLIFLLSSCVDNAESIFEDNGAYGIVELYELPARGATTDHPLKSSALEALEVAE
jgi:hypothetical protein